MKRAIFLDRDGTLIEDKGYVHKIEDFELLPGVITGLKLLKNKDYLFFIITNQSGIGKGLYNKADFYKFNNYLLTKLNENNIKIEKTCFCPHIPEDNCECRKPKTKYIEEIANEFEINLHKSWVIGDHLSDTVMGLNSGCQTIYLLTGHGKEDFNKLRISKIKPTYIANNFLSASKKILEYE
jgi:D-glycero-D-manno-heptose 1,7-bisphosphate phosphatase